MCWRPSASAPQVTRPGTGTFWVRSPNLIGGPQAGGDFQLSAQNSVSSLSRWTYEEFFSRYRLLLRGPQDKAQDQAQALCRRDLPELIPDQEQYCFGKTKVFFRAGQVALLERLRAERLRGAAVIIQSRVRGWLARIRYTRFQQAAVTVQRFWRGALARR